MWSMRSRPEWSNANAERDCELNSTMLNIFESQNPMIAPDARTNTVPPAQKSTYAPIWKPALIEAALAFFSAAFLLLAVYAIWFFNFHPEFQPFANRTADPITVAGKYFQPIIAGGGHLDGEAGVITAYKNGQAILSLNIEFEAEDYPFIKFDIEGLTTWSKARVFWRTDAEPDQIYQLDMNRSWDEVTQIAMVYGNEYYRGKVTELAIGFITDPTDHDNNGEPIKIKGVELRPFSAMRVAEQIFEDWTNPPLWQGYSNNIVRGIHANGMVFPNLVANLLVVTGVLLAGSRRIVKKYRGNPAQVRLLAVALCLCLYGWAFNDVLRWHWRLAQLADTNERYAGLPLEERIRNNPIRCGRRDDCFEHLLPYF